MKVLTGSVLTLTLLACATGCCRLTTCLENRFGDFVDHVGLQEPRLDDYYHAGLDPLRIGKPDWCQCRLNRMLCPQACACYSYDSACCGHHHACQSCHTYAHDELSQRGRGDPDDLSQSALRDEGAGEQTTRGGQR